MMADILTHGSSILIPTWNNLDYLKRCVESLKTHSRLPHQIILHINDGSDGTLEWAQSQNLTYTHTNENVGVCKGLNLAFEKAERPTIFYFNDDMIALPEWDTNLLFFAVQRNIPENAWLSSTMIEPRGDNPCCIAPANFGFDIATFREEDLLRELPVLRFRKGNIQGSTWPPNVVSAETWKSVGGYSEEFSPGFGSDPDFAKKMYDKGTRHFIGVGKSLVYHFPQTTSSRKTYVHNNGEQTFFDKYKMSINQFAYGQLQRGQEWR